MAERGRRRKNPVTRIIKDVVDDTKDLVDDVIDRAKDVEGDIRKGTRDFVDDDRRDRTAREMDSLKSALDDLTAKVTRLAALQGDANKPKS